MSEGTTDATGASNIQVDEVPLAQGAAPYGLSLSGLESLVSASRTATEATALNQTGSQHSNAHAFSGMGVGPSAIQGVQLNVSSTGQSQHSARSTRRGDSWVSHVHNVHSVLTMSPTRRQDWTERVHTTQLRERSSAHADTVQRSQRSMTTSWVRGMHSVSALAPSLPPSSRAAPGTAGPRADTGQAQRAEEELRHTVNHSISAIQAQQTSLREASRSRMRTSRPPVSLTQHEAQGHSDDEAAADVATVLSVGGRSVLPVPPPGNEAVGDGQLEEHLLRNHKDEFKKVAMELRVEPESDAEREAKFQLYETLLESVEAIRRETFALWAEVKVQFKHDNVRRDVEQKLARVDRESNLGLDWVEGRWFVFDMTLKAQANAEQLDRLLSEIKAKLELLGRSDECPVCLEGFDEASGHADVVLGCCHKVCQECWTEWTRLNPHRPFCPLCRHEEFLRAITVFHERSRSASHHVLQPPPASVDPPRDP